MLKAVSSRGLAHALRQEFAHPVYDWRTARREGWLTRFLSRLIHWIGHPFRRFFHWLAHLIVRFFHWLFGHWQLGQASPHAAPQAIGVWVWVLLGAAVAGVFILVRRQIKRGGPKPAPVQAVKAAAEELERATGAEQSEEEWLRLCRELQAAGDLRLALRAAFLACLSALQREKWLQLRRDRTNREYLQEFRRQLRYQAGGAASSERGNSFGRLVQWFDQVWYGGAAVTPDFLDSFLAAQREVLPR